MTIESGLIDLLVRSSLLLALIWLAAVCVRKAGGSAAMRHMIWLFGLGALLLFPLLSVLMPPLQLPVLPATAPPAAAEMVMSAPAVATPAVPAAVPAPTNSIGLGDLFLILYVTVAIGLLGRFALGHYLLARLWRRARPADGAHWQELLDGLTRLAGIRRPVMLRIATGPAMPMTWGTLRPRVLLPAEAAGWTDERRRVVLLHELAHVARADSLSRSVAAIICALYWGHPAIWYAARRMRLEQEHACDDLVLSLGAKASVYARNLLDVASAFQPPAIVGSMSVAMARTSELEHRLTAILRRGPRRRSSARFVTGSGAAALAATLLVATVVPVAALQQAPARTIDPPRAPSFPIQPTAAHAPSPLTAPSVPSPVTTPSPVAAPSVPKAIAREPVSSEDYDAMRARYDRELDVYNRQLEDYNRAVDAHERQVEDLRARGNLANSGNTGNSGNSGNWGNPGIPASPGRPGIAPTPPVSPVAPTWPTPPMAREAVAATAAVPAKPPT